MQAALPADTAVLAYFVGDQRSHAWLLTRTELRHGALPGRRELAGPRERIRATAARRRTGHRRFAPFAPLLGDLLNGVTAKRLLDPSGRSAQQPAVRRIAAAARKRARTADRSLRDRAPRLRWRSPCSRPCERPAHADARRGDLRSRLHARRSPADAVAAGDSANYRGADGQSGRLARLALFRHRSARRGAGLCGRGHHRARGIQRHRATRDRAAIRPISAYCTSPPTPSHAGMRRSSRRCS